MYLSFSTPDEDTLYVAVSCSVGETTVSVRRPIQCWLRTPTAVARVGFSSAFVCLFIRTISQELMQLGSSNLTTTYKCSTMSPGNSYILWSKGQGHKSQKHCRHGSLHMHSCECWFLRVTSWWSLSFRYTIHGRTNDTSRQDTIRYDTVD